MLAIAEPVVDPALPVLWVEPWDDEITDELGHDPRSAYVERFWLGTLGPSSTWLLRAIAYGLEASPAGFELSSADTARVLGLGERTGRHSPFVRAVGRLCQFELARVRAETLVARRSVPWLDQRQVRRLPVAIQAEHQAWETAESEASGPEAMRRRAANQALGIVRAGGSVDDAERALIRWKYHPSLCRSLAEWAWSQHGLARGLVAAFDPPSGGHSAIENATAAVP